VNFSLFSRAATRVELLFFDRVDDARPSRTIDLDPRNQYEANATLREVLDFMLSGGLSRGDADLFRPIVDNLLHDDPFLLLADYQAYVDCQDRVSALWRDPEAWTRTSILNTARMGKFSSDRSIREYCERVWRVKPGPVGA